MIPINPITALLNGDIPVQVAFEKAIRRCEIQQSYDSAVDCNIASHSMSMNTFPQWMSNPSAVFAQAASLIELQKQAKNAIATVRRSEDGWMQAHFLKSMDNMIESVDYRIELLEVIADQDGASHFEKHQRIVARMNEIVEQRL